MSHVADINEERMRLLGRRLAGLSDVDQVRYVPREKPDRVVVTFREDISPTHVSEMVFEFRIRLNGDFNMRYGEDWSGERWCCRWDRHENPHSAREHFHTPPDPEEPPVVDATYPDDPNRVLSVVLETITRRSNQLWTDVTDPV